MIKLSYMGLIFLYPFKRIITPKIKKELYNKTVFSMDNKELYGDVFHRLTFGKAIN